MKRQVDIYIEGTTVNNYLKLDLFDDEKINISSSIQNVQDISKVYTDFSQSFTVPASDNNNKIFEYFYQNDVDGAIDHNLRRFAYIEIGLVPFRSGKIQLEGSSVKNGKVEHYSITFYGDLTSLKDTFGNTKISELDYDFITQPTNPTEVKNRITDTTTDYDVRYPLISSEALWTYDDSSSTDIKTSAGRISHADLFPAVKVSKIFQAIQNDYNLTFQSTFLQTDKFKKLFLWCKNIDNVDEKKYGKNLTYSKINNIPSKAIVKSAITSFDGTNFVIKGLTPIKDCSISTEVTFIIDDISINSIVEIDVYVDGSMYHSIFFDSALTGGGRVYFIQSKKPYEQQIYLKIKTSNSCTIKYHVSVLSYQNGTIKLGLLGPTQTIYEEYGGLVVYQDIGLIVNNSVTSIYSTMPDITVSDFFSGVLKQFNLTCYSVGVDKFQIEPLDNWYSKGAVIDITKYVDTDTISVNRLPLYKNVSFNYQKSQSWTNVKFASNGNREWGDISSNYPYDGGEYKIDVPFENIQFVKFPGAANLQVGYALSALPDFKPYIPKPILLYYNGATTSSFVFFNGATESTITNVAVFGQDLVYNNQIYSLNFSTDTSTWHEVIVDNSLFAIYYFGYLNNLFNIKNRLTKIKAYFPIGLITSLRLNDRLVIQDKRYIINSINSDITSGEVSLELINDFRPVINQ